MKAFQSEVTGNHSVGRIPVSNWVRKETVDIDILVKSKNGDKVDLPQESLVKSKNGDE